MSKSINKAKRRSFSRILFALSLALAVGWGCSDDEATANNQSHGDTDIQQNDTTSEDANGADIIEVNDAVDVVDTADTSDTSDVSDGSDAADEPDARVVGENECRTQQDCGEAGRNCSRPGEMRTCGICRDVDDAACAADADCAEPDMVCDHPQPGDCYCGGDSDTTVCRPACSADSECGGEETCTADGHCIAIACDASTPCPTNLSCEAAPDCADHCPSTCRRDTCEHDADCADGLCVLGYCFDTFGSCELPVP